MAVLGAVEPGELAIDIRRGEAGTLRVEVLDLELEVTQKLAPG